MYRSRIATAKCVRYTHTHQCPQVFVFKVIGASKGIHTKMLDASVHIWSHSYGNSKLKVVHIHRTS